MGEPSCEYCGRCLSVCPSYRHSRIETLSPRARIDMVRAVADGSLVPGQRYAESLHSCLQCQACTEICGKGVDGAHIILEAKHRQSSASPIPSWSRLERFACETLLRRRRLLSAVLHVTGWFQRLLPSEPQGTVRHLPEVFSGFAGHRSVPNPAPLSIHAMLSETIQPRPGTVRPKGVPADVAVFTGCFGALVDTGAVAKLVEALTALGITVHVPAAQSCCGAPAAFSSLTDAFDAARRKTISIFSQYAGMPVLTVCATCYRMLSSDYPRLQPSVPDQAVADFSTRVRDAAEFLNELTVQRPVPDQTLQLFQNWRGGEVSASRPMAVAVHDPCHLRLRPEAGRELRARLDAIPWIRRVETHDQVTCCGGGGISSLKNPVLADELGQARAQAFINAGAEAVVTECPGCVLQLNNHLSRQHTSTRAAHAVSLLG